MTLLWLFIIAFAFVWLCEWAAKPIKDKPYKIIGMYEGMTDQQRCTAQLREKGINVIDHSEA